MSISLSATQQAAVDAPHGPDHKLLIISCAGSGKTQTLAERAVRVASDHFDSGLRSFVLCVCFGKDAQEELRERIDTVITQQRKAAQLVCPGNGYPGLDPERVLVLVRTLSSLGYHILGQLSTVDERRDICGLEPSHPRRFVRTVESKERSEMLKTSLAEAGVSLPVASDATGKKLLKGMLYKYERMVQEHKSEASDYECAVDDGMIEPVPNGSQAKMRSRILQGQDLRVYQLFVARMLRENSIDFHDMIGMSVKLAKGSARLAKTLRKQFGSVLVDEAQDLSSTDLALIARLGSGSLTLVGDDDQSIYGFRSGIRNWQCLMQLTRMWPALTLLKLPENRRCPASVVRFSAAVIERNKSRIAKEILPSRLEKSLAVRIAGTASAGLEGMDTVHSCL
jgi:superfamily I DNA/RNA helicase